MELVKNPLFAWYFDRCGARNEERGNRELRRELLAGLSGRVMEAGAGNGLDVTREIPCRRTQMAQFCADGGRPGCVIEAVQIGGLAW